MHKYYGFSNHYVFNLHAYNTQVSLVWQPVIQAVVPVVALPEGATVTEFAIVSVIVVQIFSRHVHGQVLYM